MTRRILCDCVYIYVVVCIRIYDNIIYIYIDVYMGIISI